MDPNRLKELLKVVKVTRKGSIPYCPQFPHPKQQLFLEATEPEVLFGGAAGPGKSSALLMAALQYAEQPNYNALIIRRTYKDLAQPGAIMDRAKEWLLPQGVKWSEKDKRFSFPSGATLTFGYIDKEGDQVQYQGAEYQFIGVDEAGQMPEAWYSFLLSRLRRNVGSNLPLRARCTANPGGIGTVWLRRRFVDEGAPNRFIPAVMTDNPSLDTEEYRKQLERLDPVLRKQLLEGVWITDGTKLVYPHYNAIINGWPKVEPECQYYLLGIDYGFNDNCAFVVMGWRDHDPNVYVFRADALEKCTPSRAAEYARELERVYQFSKMVADVGGLGKGYAEEARSRFHLPIEPAQKQNKRGYIDLFNGDMSRGRIKVHPRCEQLFKEWLEVPWNDDRTREEEGFVCDCSDAALYAWRAVCAYHNRPVDPPKPEAERIHEEIEAMWAKTSEDNARKKSEEYWMEDHEW